MASASASKNRDSARDGGADVGADVTMIEVGSEGWVDRSRGWSGSGELGLVDQPSMGAELGLADFICV